MFSIKHAYLFCIWLSVSMIYTLRLYVPTFSYLNWEPLIGLCWWNWFWRAAGDRQRLYWMSWRGYCFSAILSALSYCGYLVNIKEWAGANWEGAGKVGQVKSLNNDLLRAIWLWPCGRAPGSARWQDGGLILPSWPWQLSNCQFFWAGYKAPFRCWEDTRDETDTDSTENMEPGLWSLRVWLSVSRCLSPIFSFCYSDQKSIYLKVRSKGNGINKKSGLGQEAE